MTDIKFDIIARDKASSTFRGVGNAAESSTGKFVKFAAKAALSVASIYSIAEATKFAYKVGSEYVNSLNQIQALTGANKKQMDAAASTLEKHASLYAKMGQTTGDAAAGVVELTKAGLSLHDALKSVSATMVLAKAGELSVADASTLVANSLNTFGLKAKDAGKLANYLANAANISSADVSDLAESFKYVSPVAAAAGVSIKQTSAILAELSNSGIKASSAGTALRTFLLNLQAPAAAGAKTLADLNIQVFDAAGNMKPLPDVIDQLGGALNNLPAQQKAADLKAIFGKVGIAGAIAIIKGGKDGLDQYSKGVEKAGAASKLAQAKSQGLAGTFATIKAQVTSAAQKIYREYSPALNKRIQDFIKQFKDGTGVGGKFHDALSNIADIAKTLWPDMKKVAGYTGDFLGYLGSHKTELKLFVGAMLALKGVSIAKNSGLFSLGKGVVGKAVGATVGGVQKVFVVNPGFGSGGGGVVGDAEKAAGGVAAWASRGAIFGAAFLKNIGPAGITAGDNGNETSDRYDKARFGKGFDVNNRVDGKALLTAATGLESVRAKAAAASRSLDEIGSHAQNAAKKTVAAIKGLNGGSNNGLDSVKAHAADASRSIDLVGPHGAAAAQKAEAAISGLNHRGLDAVHQHAADASRSMDLIGSHATSALRPAVNAADILNAHLDQAARNRTADVYMNEAAALAQIAHIQYAVDQLHGKTIVIRTTGGHVTDSSQVGGGSGGGAAGSSSGGGASTGKSFDARSGQAAGVDYMTGLLKGIASKSMSVQAAISKVANALSSIKSKVGNLQGVRAGFRSTFGSDSIFGQDFSHTGPSGATINGVAPSGPDVTTPGSIADVIAFQKAQRDKARTLNADVKKVTSMGLSKALIRQLRSQGAAGAATLHALAQGTPAQIRQLNALNKQTSQSLAQAGMRAGNYDRGGSIAADIRSAKKTEHALTLLEHRLKDLDHTLKKGQTINVVIDGEAIVTAIVRRNHRKGVKSAGV